MGGIIPSERAFGRIERTVLRDELRHADQPKSGEKKKLPGRGGCKSRNEVWQILVFGKPTGGTFDLGFKVGGTTDTLTFDFDWTAAEVEDEFETHTNIANGDVSCSGGDFPNAVINVEFKGDLANMKFDHPTIVFGSLTGGSGVGVQVTVYGGHPTDGSAA